jgi:glycosyltransferase involved in cell wall biosynthesis
MESTMERPFITLVLPIRNEEKRIEACLNSVLAQDYPHDRWEVLVIDGMSTDRTREIVGGYVRQYPFIRMEDNPEKIQVVAVNNGIRMAKGLYVLRLDGHSEYESDYVSKCVYYLQETGAENVGGPYRTFPGADTLTARCIAEITRHRLVVGGSSFRTSMKPQYCDGCVFGAWRRDLFDKIGYFNEALVRGEDNEFNSRLMHHGGKVFMTPDIRLRYYNQATLRGLMRQAYGNGIYHVLTMIANPLAFRIRYFAPCGFLLWLILFATLSFLNRAFVLPLMLAVVPYTIAAMAVAVQIGRSNGWSMAPLVPHFMFAYHAAYGAGIFGGVVRFVVFGRKEREKARQGSMIPDAANPPRLGLNAINEEELARL